MLLMMRLSSILLPVVVHKRTPVHVGTFGSCSDKYLNALNACISFCGFACNLYFSIDSINPSTSLPFLGGGNYELLYSKLPV